MEQNYPQRGHLALNARFGLPAVAAACPATPAALTPTTAVRLPGDFVVWLLVLLELLTFGMLFLAFAGARLHQPALFAAGQATLDLNSGAINTALLVSASACAAQALHSVKAQRSRSAARWLIAALIFGLGFLGVKSLEYAAKWQEGIDIANNTFAMLYVGITGFHFLHAAVGCLLFALLWWPTRQGRYGPANCHTLETVTVFWHMVDLLWMVLFPLIYVLR